MENNLLLFEKEFESFKEKLGINNPIIGIDFIEMIPTGSKYYQDTACTALARVKIKKEATFFDGKKYPQLCSGAGFFLKYLSISKEEAKKVYVEDEQVFENGNVCDDYLKSLPQMPGELVDKVITIKPLTLGDKPKVVILVVNPAQANRIIGLLNYSKYEKIDIHPNQPTCLSIFAPLATGLPHINFIDYYDRYFQGKVDNIYIWAENEMIVSLTLRQFLEILNNFPKSSQGSFERVNLDVQKIESLA